LVVALLSLAALIFELVRTKTASHDLKSIPALLPAPSSAEQTEILGAMRAHPNPPFDLGESIPRGTDAVGLAPLLRAMERGGERDGAVEYHFVLTRNASDYSTTLLFIEIAGDPPRVIHRRVETVFGD
jgi:hypothetical protein